MQTVWLRLALISVCYSCTTPSRPVATSSSKQTTPSALVNAFVHDIDHGEFDSAYRKLSSEIRTARPQAFWTDQVKTIRSGLAWQSLLKEIKPEDFVTKVLDKDHWKVTLSVMAFDFSIGKAVSLDF